MNDLDSPDACTQVVEELFSTSTVDLLEGFLATLTADMYGPLC